LPSESVGNRVWVRADHVCSPFRSFPITTALDRWCTNSSPSCPTMGQAPRLIWWAKAYLLKTCTSTPLQQYRQPKKNASSSSTTAGGGSRQVQRRFLCSPSPSIAVLAS
jgi:hypothetical protein